MSAHLLRRPDLIAEVERRTGCRLKQYVLADMIRFGTLPIASRDIHGRHLYTPEAVDQVVRVLTSDGRSARR
jgi:hypothetical protein